MRATIEGLGRRGVTFVASDVQDPVLAELKRDGLLELIGEDHVFGGVGEALRAYQGLPAGGDPRAAD